MFSIEVNMFFCESVDPFISSLFNFHKVLSPASDKAKFLTVIFSENSNLDDPGSVLLAFSSRTNLKLDSLPATLNSPAEKF